MMPSCFRNCHTILATCFQIRGIGPIDIRGEVQSGALHPIPVGVPERQLRLANFSKQMTTPLQDQCHHSAIPIPTAMVSTYGSATLFHRRPPPSTITVAPLKDKFEINASAMIRHPSLPSRRPVS